MIMTQGCWSLNIFYDLFNCLRFLKGFLNAILQVLISLTRKLRKKNTHTNQTVFSLKNHGQIFLKPLVFAIQF